MGKGGAVSQQLEISICPLGIFKADLLQTLSNFTGGHSPFEKEGNLILLHSRRRRLSRTEKGIVGTADRVGVCPVVR
jgi:hypothetical protein